MEDGRNQGRNHNTRMIPTYPLERITWLDSNGRSRWDTIESYKEWAHSDLTCVTVGFVIFDGEDRVSVVQNLTAASADNGMTIPKCAIVKRESLSAVPTPPLSVTTATTNGYGGLRFVPLDSNGFANVPLVGSATSDFTDYRNGEPRFGL